MSMKQQQVIRLTFGLERWVDMNHN